MPGRLRGALSRPSFTLGRSSDSRRTRNRRSRSVAASRGRARTPPGLRRRGRGGAATRPGWNGGSGRSSSSSESTSSSARSGAPASATATARLSSTTGEPVRRRGGVERGDLVPVDVLLGLQRRDRRLEHVRPARRATRVPDRAARARPRPGPGRATANGPARRAGPARRLPHAAVAARVVEQHQGQQPVDLRLVGHQLGQQPPQPDRLGGEVAATGRSPR